jgi:hypothetical protein
MSPDLCCWLVERVTFVDEIRSSVFRLHTDHVIWCLKNNAASARLSVFRAQMAELEGVGFEGHTILGLALTADLPQEEEILMPDEPPLTKAAIAATQWLRDALAFGPRSVNDLRRESRDARFSWTTIAHAKDTLGVISPVAGVWRLPMERRIP